MLAEFLDEGGSVVGSDIVPGEVEFCREQFAHSFPNASFYCVGGCNSTYDSSVAMTKNRNGGDRRRSVLFEVPRGI